MAPAKKNSSKKNPKSAQTAQLRTVDNTRGSTLWSFNYFRQNILTNLLDDLYDLEATGMEDNVCSKIQSFLEYFGNAATDIPKGGFMTGPIYKDIERFTTFYLDWNNIRGEGEENPLRGSSAILRRHISSGIGSGAVASGPASLRW